MKIGRKKLATKINDTDACPCGQPRQYGQCHGQDHSNNGWRALRTDEAIAEILCSSRTLRNFYNQQVRQYSDKILYAVDLLREQALPTHNLQNVITSRGNHIMLFDSVNVGRAQDSIIAHEYTHIILQEEGFPTPLCDPNNEESKRVCGMLTNILQDPLIYRRLNGIFDVRRDFMDNYRANLFTYIQNRGLPIEGIYVTISCLACARSLLIEEELYHQDVTGLLGLIETQYQRHMRLINRVLRMFHETGYDTPDQQRLLLNNLSRELRLQQYIQNIYPHQP